MHDFVLPKGWEWKKLGEVCDKITGGGTPSREVSEYFDGDIVWLTPTEINKEKIEEVIDSREKLSEVGFKNSSARLVMPGTVLMTSRASIGFVAIAGKPLTTNQGFANFECSEELFNWYLAFWLFSQKDEFVGLASGTTFKEISKSVLKELQIPLPPLPTQRRIVAKIDACFTRLDEAIQLQKQNLARTAELKKSVLEEVFGKGEWDRVKIEKIAYIKGGKRLPKGKSLMTEKTKYPYIRVADFTESGTIDADKVMYLDEETQKSIKNYIISSNDLYISIAGTIGRTGIIPKEFEGANLTENAARLVYKHPDSISNKFVYYFTISRFFTDQAIDATKTVAQPKLALTRLAQIEIPLLSALSEQQKIVAHLDRAFTRIDALHAEQTARLQHLESLKSSILAEAFQGKL